MLELENADERTAVRTADQDARVTELLRTYDRAVEELLELEVDVTKARPDDRLRVARTALGEIADERYTSLRHSRRRHNEKENVRDRADRALDRLRKLDRRIERRIGREG